MEGVKRFGRYEVVRVLGNGAMGVVYEGHDSRLNRRVAIKTIVTNAATGDTMAADYAERFMREAHAVARLNHSNIVTVYDFGEEDGVAYLVMEFIEGQDLKSFLERSERIPLTRVLELTLDLLSALAYAHAQGIVHRDIKPANIMIDQSGRLKLTDFGVVKVLDSHEGTQAGTIVGTPGYMSPEQILGSAIGPRADLFSVGVVLYLLLTGRKPFTGDGVFAIQQKIVNCDYAPPSTLVRALPPVLDQIVAHALTREPDSRYANAEAFAEDIRSVLPLSQSILVGGQSVPAEGQVQAVSTTEAPTVVTGSDAASPDAKTIALASTLSHPQQYDLSDMDSYVAEREKLDSMFLQKFTRFVTVMFTDLKGSTTIAEKEGDMVSRMLIKAQANIVLPAIKDNHGVFVKAIGDGSLSYFEDALDAVRAAARIQKGMDELNMSKRFHFPVLMRIGLHSGKCVVEEKDIYGDVVNTASRFESSADPGGILLSEDTYNALTNKSEIYCRFAKQVTLKGKAEAFNAYKAFWNPREIELDKQGADTLARQQANVPTRWSGAKVVMALAVLIVVVSLLMILPKMFGAAQGEQKRSVSDTVGADAASNTGR